MKGYLLTEPGQPVARGANFWCKGKEGHQETEKMVFFMRPSSSDTGKYFTHLFIYLILSSRFCCFGNLVFGIMISVTVLDYLSLVLSFQDS